MPSGGDTTYYQKIHQKVSVDYDLVAGEAGPVEDLLTPKSANHRIYIQHILIAITTYSAKTLTFRDDASTPVPVAHFSIPASAPTGGGAQEYSLDFFADGTPLTMGKNLDLILSGAGVAGRIHIEGYQRLVGPVAAASTN